MRSLFYAILAMQCSLPCPDSSFSAPFSSLHRPISEIVANEVVQSATLWIGTRTTNQIFHLIVQRTIFMTCVSFISFLSIIKHRNLLKLFSQLITTVAAVDIPITADWKKGILMRVDGWDGHFSKRSSGSIKLIRDVIHLNSWVLLAEGNEIKKRLTLSTVDSNL